MLRTDRLRQMRLIAGYSQEKLSEIVGIGSRQIWRYENGENVPDADVLAAIATTLGVSADYLLGLTDEPLPYVEKQIATFRIELDKLIFTFGLENTAKFLKMMGVNLRVGIPDGWEPDHTDSIDDQK